MEKEKVNFYNITPGGAKADWIHLTPVPNADNSHWEYKVEYQQYEGMDMYEVGRLDPITGRLSVAEAHSMIRHVGLTHTALLLIGKWVQDNLEEY